MTSSLISSISNTTYTTSKKTRYHTFEQSQQSSASHNFSLQHLIHIDSLHFVDYKIDSDEYDDINKNSRSEMIMIDIAHQSFRNFNSMFSQNNLMHEAHEFILNQRLRYDDEHRASLKDRSILSDDLEDEEYSSVAAVHFQNISIFMNQAVTITTEIFNFHSHVAMKDVFVILNSLSYIHNETSFIDTQSQENVFDFIEYYTEENSFSNSLSQQQSMRNTNFNASSHQCENSNLDTQSQENVFDSIEYYTEENLFSNFLSQQQSMKNTNFDALSHQCENSNLDIQFQEDVFNSIEYYTEENSFSNLLSQ